MCSTHHALLASPIHQIRVRQDRPVRIFVSARTIIALSRQEARELRYLILLTRVQKRSKQELTVAVQGLDVDEHVSALLAFHPNSHVPCLHTLITHISCTAQEGLKRALADVLANVKAKLSADFPYAALVMFRGKEELLVRAGRLSCVMSLMGLEGQCFCSIYTYTHT